MFFEKSVKTKNIVKTLNRAYKRMINRIMRGLYILKTYFNSKNTEIVKWNFCCLSKQYYQDTLHFFSQNIVIKLKY